MAAPTPRLEPFRPTPPDTRLPAVLRDPVRLLTMAGGLGLIVGSALDWAQVWLPGYGFQDVSSFERAGDGAITLVLGIIITAISLSDGMATARVPAVVILPGVLGLAALACVKLGWDQDQSYIASLAGAGGYGSMLPGFWLTLVAAALAFAGGAAHVYRTREHVSFSVRVTSGTLTTIASGVVGAVVGIGAAVVIGEDFSTNPTVTGSAVTFLSILLGLVGAWLGSKIGRAFIGGSTDEGEV